MKLGDLSEPLRNRFTFKETVFVNLNVYRGTLFPERSATAVLLMTLIQ